MGVSAAGKNFLDYVIFDELERTTGRAVIAVDNWKKKQVSL